MATFSKQAVKRSLRGPVSAALDSIPLERVRPMPQSPVKVALLRLIDRRLTMQPVSYEGVVTRYGFLISGRTSDRIQRWIYLFGVWEPNLSTWMSSYLRPGDVVVDVGANIGYFTCLASQAVGGEGHVVAFEPVPAILTALRANIDRNGISNVDVLPYIAADESGEAPMFQAGEHNLGRSSTDASEGFEPVGSVKMVKAADVIDPALWSRIRVIKIDVEGDELRVLRGLEPILAALPKDAAVVAEIAPDRLAARGMTTRQAMALMENLGFRAYEILNDYTAKGYAAEVQSAPQLLTGDPTGQVDVLFVKQ
jgi:FkbM family methyltransferase